MLLPGGICPDAAETKVGFVAKTSAPSESTHYDANYARFTSDLYTAIRSEAFGEDIGQNSWLTASEQNAFLPLLNLSPGRNLLDVACGSGGPALRIVVKTGCSLVGIDLHEQAISTGVTEQSRTLR